MHFGNLFIFILAVKNISGIIRNIKKSKYIYIFIFESEFTPDSGPRGHFWQYLEYHMWYLGSNPDYVHGKHTTFFLAPKVLVSLLNIFKHIALS